MRTIVLLGAPGAGKGTQAVRIAEKYGLPHISTGDIFRKNIREGTEVGKLAKSYIDRGQLVPDEVTVRIVRERLAEDDCKAGWLLDGFPRTPEQAEALAGFASTDLALDLEVDEDALVARLTGRRVCEKCGKSDHIDFLGGATTCRACGGKLIRRDDDREETVRERLEVYRTSTAPLIGYYREKGILVTVSANGSVDEVFGRCVEAIERD